MAPSAALHLFPPTTTSLPPRRPSLRQTPVKAVVDGGASSELKGMVALHISAKTTVSPVIQPARDCVKHSLSSSPPSTLPSETQNISSTRSQRPEQDKAIAESPQSTTKSCSTVGVDVLGPLPKNQSFVPRKRSGRQQLDKRRPSLRNPSKITSEKATMSMESIPTTPKNDENISPLPTFSPPPRSSPPRDIEYPAPISERSGSPTLVRSNSGASYLQPSSPPAMRSIFPQYDPSKTLNQQLYYPTSHRTTPILPTDKISKVGSPVRKPTDGAYHQDGFVEETFVNGYEHIPRADESDLLELWKASCSHFPVSPRKVLLRLNQPQRKGTQLCIGMSPTEPVYSMAKDGADLLVIKKHCPKQSSFTPVAQLKLPDPEMALQDKRENAVSIFPQMAAVHAQKTASTLPSSSSEDPVKTLSQTAGMTRKAISEAYSQYCCQLECATRKRDSLGAVDASYSLKHPSLGTFAVTISKSIEGRHAKDPRAKISLHHPSASPGAVMAGTLVLAFLDFARDACVLDVPALLALDGPYVIDTIVASLLAVAVIENDALMAEALTFDPPPKAPLPNSSSKRKSILSGSEVAGSSPKPKKWYTKKTSKKEKVIEDKDELPVLTQGALAVLGLSFKTAVWVLETGVKVTAGVIVGVSHVASKA